MNKFKVGDQVNWLEGRTQRQKYGLVEQVHELEGWPAEYTVRPLKKNGNPGKLTRRLYESELEADLTITVDTCCHCLEPLGQPQACNCCYRSVCASCARTDGTGDVYCPDCWSDLQAFLGEGVSYAPPASTSYGGDFSQMSTALPSYGQKQF